jgi:hypothetical protein
VIETEGQRRWWFATHPEYSQHRPAEKTRESDKQEQAPPVPPEEVDAYVDRLLQYERDPVMIELHKQTKFWFGSEFARKSPEEQHALLWGDEAKAGSDDEPEKDSFGSAYDWAKNNWEEALNLSLSALFGPLAGPERVAKAIRSLEKRLAEHEQKRADYIRDPDAYDNKGFLRNAASPEIRQQIVQARTRELQRQINIFKRDIARLKGDRR